MSIISTTMLAAELPTSTDSTYLQKAVNRATSLVNSWAVKYDKFPDYTTVLTVEQTNAPEEIVMITTEIAKVCYFMSIGQVYRDGEEQQTWASILDEYKDRLKDIDIEPTEYSVAISLDSNGVQLIARAQNILRFHPHCRVVSGSTNIWNQCYHWEIRKGLDSEDEHTDGWYLDAEEFEDTVEGTLYYYRTWRNDGLDYQRYRPHRLSRITEHGRRFTYQI
jgi:hypothetical protein